MQSATHEQGVKEAICVSREQSSLNNGAGLLYNLSQAYNSVIIKIPIRGIDCKFFSTSTCDLNIPVTYYKDQQNHQLAWRCILERHEASPFINLRLNVLIVYNLLLKRLIWILLNFGAVTMDFIAPFS